MRPTCQPFAALVVVAVLLAHTMGFAQSYPPTVTEKVLSAQKEVATIGMADYRKLVDHPGHALIIDVREPDEFRAGHVPGAINIPRGLLEFHIWKQVGFPARSGIDKPLYLQCSSGNRASLAAKSLKELGFTDVTAVVMTLDEWQKADNPFVK
ncbi:MAG TPA: rhodanese-like domain-containing protein [Nitrospira sp.]|nr:rhodanese-like domain-containing protein [Nitrospira sp.]